jgi:hypothetical protein
MPDRKAAGHALELLPGLGRVFGIPQVTGVIAASFPGRASSAQVREARP